MLEASPRCSKLVLVNARELVLADTRKLVLVDVEEAEDGRCPAPAFTQPSRCPKVETRVAVRRRRKGMGGGDMSRKMELRRYAEEDGDRRVDSVLSSSTVFPR